MSWNLHARLKALFPQQPLEIGEILASGDTTCTVALRTGAQVTVRGTGTVGDFVYIRGDVIEGPATELPGTVLYE